MCVCVSRGGGGRLSTARVLSAARRGCVANAPPRGGSPVTLICARLWGRPVGPFWDANKRAIKERGRCSQEEKDGGGGEEGSAAAVEESKRRVRGSGRATWMMGLHKLNKLHRIVAD